MIHIILVALNTLTLGYLLCEHTHSHNFNKWVALGIILNLLAIILNLSIIYNRIGE